MINPDDFYLRMREVVREKGLVDDVVMVQVGVLDDRVELINVISFRHFLLFQFIKIFCSKSIEDEN